MDPCGQFLGHTLDIFGLTEDRELYGERILSGCSLMSQLG
jgi:hypothetical protein